ncbi:ribosome biogenesis GTP-binding protein YihA/YsxC [Acinetobacter schindleri]|jgi:GTP-binding protein|uniref:Probable GTP-binding protein EngB n=1 Tax=Acinetobacter schindleri NIPH 900 TaxID=1217675 RepID=N8XYG4_9GAMM|nr:MULTISPECIES: ribosome biogenesis GTP-binding protein YihA/YsxC [Acinetobacter]AWD69715.1 YihA family ribosome biogenesis GTP-binding protein [Acinetobacter schindleri]ENV12085.1 ribosome biogenesis GTP-binding protein YsxC [Acinetobacter schindleri NIPH 900]POU27504.1 YihA family ribosome biogenesis GTP-binding protein [Acinetobacter sp. ACNIH3]POV79743.1 YihA family ribosome biogenesis GTP-binding protein [Acinetobacter sp. ACNIH4]RAZ03832.1 YihA family ribosome biogenesis GTP-binding pro
MHHSRGKSKNSKAAAAPKQKISYTKKVDPAITEYSVRSLNWLRKAEFLMSAPKLNLCVEDTGYEVAFAGRSNAGKSSAINALTNQKQLARASKKPGRTQMINFFSLGNPDQRLVDLPGYGYAAVPEAMKIVWQKELENYLIHRKSLQGLVLLMDIRHPLQHFDVMMLEWAYSRHLFVHVLLTKSDKLNRGPASKALQEVKATLNKMKLNFSIQLFSSLNKEGLEELASVMAGRLNFTLDQPTEFDLDNIPEASIHDLNEADEPIESVELEDETDSDPDHEITASELNNLDEPVEADQTEIVNQEQPK